MFEIRKEIEGKKKKTAKVISSWIHSVSLFSPFLLRGLQHFPSFARWPSNHAESPLAGGGGGELRHFPGAVGFHLIAISPSSRCPKAAIARRPPSSSSPSKFSFHCWTSLQIERLPLHISFALRCSRLQTVEALLHLVGLLSGFSSLHFSQWRCWEGETCPGWVTLVSSLNSVLLFCGFELVRSWNWRNWMVVIFLVDSPPVNRAVILVLLQVRSN